MKAGLEMEDKIIKDYTKLMEEEGHKGYHCHQMWVLY